MNEKVSHTEIQRLESRQNRLMHQERQFLRYFIRRFCLQVYYGGTENLESLGNNGYELTIFPHKNHTDSKLATDGEPSDHRERTVFLAKAKNWGSPVKRFLGELTNPLIPIQVEENVIPLTALKQAKALLENNYIVGIAPEGTRSNLPTDKRSFEPGFIWLLYMTKFEKPLVPVILVGPGDIWSKGQKLPHFYKRNGLLTLERKQVFVYYGQPVLYKPVPKKGLSDLVLDYQQRCQKLYEEAVPRAATIFQAH